MRPKIAFLTCVMFVLAVSFAMAQDWQSAGEEWIAKWWMLSGFITNTGGFNDSATHDWLDEGTNGEITDASASTWAGLMKTEDIVVSLPNNGGDLTWEVHTIDTTSNNNMSVTYGLADETNVESYAIIVISSPSARTTTMHPAHDDYAHIWLNGDKVYDNPNWTTGAALVTTPTEVNLKKGTNVLLYRCGESGGSDYFNLHFEAADADLKLLPTNDDKFFEIINTGAAVEPDSKFKTKWGEVK
jgi:hypothetical protein